MGLYRRTIRRRTAIKWPVVGGFSYRREVVMSGRRNPKTVMRYDHGRENLEQSPVSFLKYDEE